MKKILLSQKINPAGMALLEGKFEVITAPDCSAETMLALSKDVSAIILRTTSKVDREVIENAKNLEIISRTGAGVDNVDIEAASQRKILVCSLPRANNLSVCEHAIALLMASSKQLQFMQDGVRQGNWKARNAGTPVEIEGKTLGVVGMGHIGSLVAKKCHDGLGMKIIAYDPFVAEKYKDYDYQFCANLEELFAESDFITLHCPNIPETKGMITRELLFSMKPSAIFINTARGPVVDELALIDLLTEKRIAAAGLDVFEQEPPEADNPLLHMDNVFVTPHSAALTKEASIRMSYEAAEAVADYFSGKEPLYIYNRKDIGMLFQGRQIMEKQYDVLSFGEAMVRFTAPDHMRLEQAGQLQMAITAAELSVSVNTAKLGLKTTWVSKLVDTWSGKYIIGKGRESGVDMTNVVMVPYDGVGRIRNGLAFIEVGIGPRASRMIYDRGHSAVSHIKPGDINWEEIMPRTKWFHTTGITTALSDSMAQEALTALKTAKKHGVKTSLDLNYRSTLWSAQKAQTVLQKLIPYVDVLLGNEEDFETCLGIMADGTSHNYSQIDPQSYESVAKKARELYPNIEMVGTTLRDAKTGLLNDWQTAMSYKGKFYVSRKYENLEINDRIGGGDSFASALIYGCIINKEPQEMIDFAAAYSALCHGFMGDWNWATKEEAESVMKGENARVKR